MPTRFADRHAPLRMTGVYFPANGREIGHYGFSVGTGAVVGGHHIDSGVCRFPAIDFGAVFQEEQSTGIEILRLRVVIRVSRITALAQDDKLHVGPRCQRPQTCPVQTALLSRYYLGDPLTRFPCP